MKMKKIVTTLLNKVNDIKQMLFRSENIAYSKYSVEGDGSVEDRFLSLAKEAGVVFGYVDSYGGEGLGEQYWVVYKFTKGSESIFVKFAGSYTSYDGPTYDDWFFVEGKTVEVVEYFRVT